MSKVAPIVHKKIIGAVLSISDNMTSFGQKSKIKSTSQNMTKCARKYSFGSHDCIKCTLKRKF